MSALREVSNLPAKSAADNKLKVSNRSVNIYTTRPHIHKDNNYNIDSITNNNNNNSNISANNSAAENTRSSAHNIIQERQSQKSEVVNNRRNNSNNNNNTKEFACSAELSQRLRPLLREPHKDDPLYCADLIEDIMFMFFAKEKEAVRKFNEGIASYDSNTGNLHRYYASPHYLQYQPEINETMRMILVDWLIDVHIKYKLRPETMFLTVNVIDRYLSCQNTKFNSNTFVKRSKLQLVGICSLLLASKYEEIWPIEIEKCVHITANSYNREEIIEMERAMCGALCFRFTVPTSFQFATRLLNLLDGDDFLLEHQQEQQIFSQQTNVICNDENDNNESDVNASVNVSNDDDCDRFELTSERQRLSMINANVMNINNAMNKPIYSKSESSSLTNVNYCVNDVNKSEAMKKLLTEQHTLLKHVTHFFMEHAMLDYKCLQYTPSQIANACVFLALVTLRLKYNVPIAAVNVNTTNTIQRTSTNLQSARQQQSQSQETFEKYSSCTLASESSMQATNSLAFHSIDSFSLAPEPTSVTSKSVTPTSVWSDKLRYYSRAEVGDFRVCANMILEYVNYVPTTKYQAVRRKYSMVKNGEVTKMMMPNELPKR